MGFVVSDLQRVAERAGFRLVKCIYEQSQKTALAKEFNPDDNWTVVRD